jgi:hypothetical protein
LVARKIEVLAEVTFAMQEGYPDHGQAEIGGSAQGVSGKDTETTAISGHRRVETDLHGKVSDRARAHFSRQHFQSGTIDW